MCRGRQRLCLVANSLRSVDQTSLRVFIAVCDHYEPMWAAAGRDLQRERVARWLLEYPESVAGIHDSAGRPPQHTFFYPEEEYEPEYLDQLAKLCQAGYGNVEVHLHHDGDTSAALCEKLERYIDHLHHRHGLLHRPAKGRITYGFIHGNWRWTIRVLTAAGAASMTKSRFFARQDVTQTSPCLPRQTRVRPARLTASIMRLTTLSDRSRTTAGFTPVSVSSPRRMGCS